MFLFLLWQWALRIMSSVLPLEVGLEGWVDLDSQELCQALGAVGAMRGVAAGL